MNDAPLPKGTVGMVLADVAGSTRLWQDHADVMGAVMARLDAIVDGAATKHEGSRPREQGEGDSFVAVFPRVSDAIAFALEMQLATRAEPWPGGIDLRVRMAVHAGEVELRDGADYLGGAMNRAGRLRALAAGGQTLVSGAAHDLADDHLPAHAILVDAGAHRLRDLERPERVFELTHPGITEEFPPLRSADTVPNNLPTQLTSFVGREAELAQVTALLATHRLVTVTGPGGAGKTRLAVRAASVNCDDFPGGVWFVDLAEITDGALVAQAAASALRVVETSGRSVLDAVVAALAGHRCLMVLDNCEHVVVGAASVADHLLRHCPDLTLLATSREPVGVDGEITWRIPTLSLPGDDESGAALVASEAVRLFIDRAVAVRPNFSVTNDSAPAVAAICQRLDGIPLAIELAAARVRVLSPQQIAAGLDDRFKLLGAGPRSALPRQATLTASVDWSVDLLDDAERCLLTRLSVFAGSFDLDAVEAVCSAPPLAPHRLLDLLDALVQKSLAVTEDTGDAVRFRLLETIRQYARARLNPDELTALRDAHLQWYAGVAERLNAAPEETGDRLARIDLDYPNMRVALDHAAEGSGDSASALRMGAALVPHWVGRGLTSEGHRWLKAILDQEGGDVALRARARWGQGELFNYSGDFGAALEASGEALALAEQVGDVATQTLALSGLAYAVSMAAGPEHSDPLVARTLELIPTFDEPFASAHSRFQTASALFIIGGHRESRRLYEECLEIHDRTGIYNRHAPLILLAMSEIHLGDLDAALGHATEGRDLARGVGHEYWSAIGDLIRALALAFRGDASDAVGALAQAQQSALQSGDPVADGFISSWGITVNLVAGDLDGMEERAAVVSEKMRNLGLPDDGGIGAASMSYVHLLRGDLERAVEAATEAEAGRAGAGHRNSVLYQRLGETAVRRAAGDIDAAREIAHDSLDIAVDGDGLIHIPTILDAIAGLLVDVEADEEAVRLFAAVDAMRTERGWAIWKLAEPRREADVAMARQRLGDDAFEQAWAEGSALSLEEAIAYARRGRGERRRPSAGWASLTPTEKDVVRLVADGLSNDAVAEKLFVSRNTVRTHLRNIFTKLDVTSRTELAAEAHRRAGPL